MLFRLIVFFRWVRLTTRRYGFWAVFTKHRPKRAGFGHGLRVPFCQHSWGTPAMYLVRQLQLERAMALETTVVLA
jgi:hypothetical protein